MIRSYVVAVAVGLVLVVLILVVPAFIAPDDGYQLGRSSDHVPSFGPGWAPIDNVPTIAPGVRTTTTTTRPPSRQTTTVRGGGAVEPYPTDELLHALAGCETGQRYDNPNTGNGYYGYFQFDLDTWRSVGGSGYPHEHPYEVQRDLARALILRAGWGRFPHCSRAIGAR